MIVKRLLSWVTGGVALCLPLSSGRAEAPCPPTVQLHGESDLTAKARSMLSPSIQLLEADAPAQGCPATQAWISKTELGIMLVVKSPWGVDARAVQSLELAVALLESWSVEAGGAEPTFEPTDRSDTILVLEPRPPRPEPNRRFSITAHSELSTISGRSVGVGAEVSAGPIFLGALRPFLSFRGGGGFDFPSYAGRGNDGALVSLQRSARELGMLIGLEVELRPTRWLNVDLALCGGLAWVDVDQTSSSPSPDVGARSFIDPVAEARTSLGWSLSDAWAIELSLRLASMRDLSRVMIPPAEDETLDYDGFLFTTRVGLGLRWTLTTEVDELPSIPARLY